MYVCVYTHRDRKRGSFQNHKMENKLRKLVKFYELNNQMWEVPRIISSNHMKYIYYISYMTYMCICVCACLCIYVYVYI